MLEKQHNMKSFSIGELFNNNKGQSAIALVTAYMLCVVGSGSFLYCVLSELPYLTDCCIITGLGTALFGVRAIKKDS